MEHQPDFKELLELFNARNVEYLIVGAYALAFHGAPRMTGELDILVLPTRKNAVNILAALSQFGFGTVGLRAEDFLDPDRVVQLGVPPVRIDLLTSLTGSPGRKPKVARLRGSMGGRRSTSSADGN
jgi:hypothetical protein